jgi:hypothetical protein
VTAPLGAELNPKPRALCAFTVQVYNLPVVAPATVIGLAAAVPVFVAPPLLEMHVAV